MRIFISYSHKQDDWVCGRLLPCLVAGGAEVLIDRQRFTIGKPVVGQMDTIQDQAERHILVLSPEYLKSDYCQHEMKRALKKDPGFNQGLVIPLLREDCLLPKAFKGWNPPLYAKLQDDTKSGPWNALLTACDANELGSSAPDWLSARDEIAKLLNRNKSVNLVVQGRRVNWKSMLNHLAECHVPGLAQVNLEDPDTSTRSGLLSSISQALGDKVSILQEPRDLASFKAVLMARTSARVALTHFDLVPHRSCYDVDLFATLRYLIMDVRKLTLLVESHTAFGTLLPRGHPLSDIDRKSVV